MRGEHSSGRNLQSGFKTPVGFHYFTTHATSFYIMTLGSEKAQVALNDYEAAMKERASQFLSAHRVVSYY